MKTLGIDYGTKKVGVAMSDESGVIAVPWSVWPNDKKLAEKISELCQREGVEALVIGESLDYHGRWNRPMRGIIRLQNILHGKTNLPVFLEPEFLTTKEAMREAGKDGLVDARAAALILRSFLERRRL